MSNRITVNGTMISYRECAVVYVNGKEYAYYPCPRVFNYNVESGKYYDVQFTANNDEHLTNPRSVRLSKPRRTFSKTPTNKQFDVYSNINIPNKVIMREGEPVLIGELKEVGTVHGDGDQQLIDFINQYENIDDANDTYDYEQFLNREGRSFIWRYLPVQLSIPDHATNIKGCAWRHDDNGQHTVYVIVDPK